MLFIELTRGPISPEKVIAQVRTSSSGCVVTYVGLIRDSSDGRAVAGVEYDDVDGRAEARLRELAQEAERRFPINAVAICHRLGKLKVGDINLVVAVAAAHRQEGFAASQYVINRFKESLPTVKKETYLDGTSSG